MLNNCIFAAVLKREEMYKFKGGIVFLFCFIIVVVNAQVPKVGDPTEKTSDQLDSLYNTRSTVKNLMFTPYVAPTYTPELELLFSAGALMSFKLQKDNPFVDRSSIPFSVGYSTNESVSIAAFPYIYGKTDKMRLLTMLFYRDMPDNYWGVGYDAGNRTSTPDETTRYHRQWFSAEGKIVHRINKSLFVGVTYDFNSTKATELNDYMRSDIYVQKYGKSATNFGLGLALDLDKRDNVQNPYKGHYFSISFLKYNNFLKIGDSNEFLKATLDARKYLNLGDRRVWAFQFKTQYSDGEIPWMDLPQLGTQFDLRGYQWGRFRDKVSLFGITEYRHMFSGMRLPSIRRYLKHVGFVVWSGFGSVASSYEELEDFLPNLGAGLRIEIQPRMNLRLDYGIAKDRRGFYVAFSEAF